MLNHSSYLELSKISAAVIALSISVGCAHSHFVEGVQPAQVVPEGTRVRIGSPEVKEGDTVDVFTVVCKNSYSGSLRDNRRSCDKKKTGQARILKVVDQDSAVATPLDGSKIEPGMLVEKMK
jgi:hypothetical protein